MNKQLRRTVLIRIGWFHVISVLILVMTAIGCGGGSGSSSGTKPEARFTVSVDIGSFPLAVAFDASESTDSDGSITQYDWDFGDGSTGSESVIRHNYTSPGTYQAQLTVTDNSGLSDTHSHEIQVKPQYTISGTISSAEHVIVDSDVNDSNTIPVSNNSFSDAQQVQAPCSISGYVNAPDCGPSGASFRQGDENDVYRVTLTRGMCITLYMAADPSQADLTLYLYDSNRRLVDASLTFRDVADSLTVPTDGTYYVRVEAVDSFRYRSSSVYALTMGLINSQEAQHALRLSDNFVSGEVMVRFEEHASTTVAAFAGDAFGDSPMGFSTNARFSNRDKLLHRSTKTDKTVFFTQLGIQAALTRSLSPGHADSETTAKLETLWMVRALRGQSGVEFAEPNYIRKAFRVPNDTFYTYQWHYPLINLPEAWEIDSSGNDVIVAVIDTGILQDHPDLEGQIVAGYDFISDPDISLDGDGLDDDPNDPGDEDVGGSSFHGTHVAGTVAALSDNDIGVSGIAWNAKLMALRVLGKGGGTANDILEAVKYAAGLKNNSGLLPARKADIINLSLGGEGYSQIEEAVYAEVREKGVIIIAAAGNSGTDEVLYPAGYDNVVSVSAATIDETLASYSSFGANIDVAAPGGDSTDENGDGYPDAVLSTIGDDSSGSIEMGYAFAAGTSMAAPHVSGVVALMKALYPSLTPDTFDSLLAAGYLTQDIGDSGRDNKFGYGLIDAYKAVLTAQAGGVNGEIPAILLINPSALNFGTSLSSADVTVKNGGGGSLTLSNYYTDASWLSARPSTDVDADTGLGTYTIEVIRDDLSEGTYNATVTFDAGTNKVTVTVVMQVASVTETSSGGYHYILLLDPDTYATRYQKSTLGDNGLYSYEFSGLSYGDTYLIYAGTDPDHDGIICDDGEVCGAYLSLDKPVELAVIQDTLEVNFTTDIILNLPYISMSSQYIRTMLPLQRDVLKEIKK